MIKDRKTIGALALLIGGAVAGVAVIMSTEKGQEVLEKGRQKAKKLGDDLTGNAAELKEAGRGHALKAVDKIEKGLGMLKDCLQQKPEPENPGAET